ncbi:MAG: phenylalanine--tRNA ligase subunit alpha [Hyphomicrobium sp.]|nr:phenylalanine--tRNA ligase subunit alpha [Hyphomicrobium sp.]PPC81152.1 MAG: phenylalanine--tRNA ligase subunit alpha [Hyphomicrobium sp.]
MSDVNKSIKSALKQADAAQRWADDFRRKHEAIIQAAQNIVRPDVLENLKRINDQALKQIREIEKLHDLNGIRTHIIGKKSDIDALIRMIPQLQENERRPFGAASNQSKALLAEAFEYRKAELELEEVAARLANERSDITLPVRVGPEAQGRIHPVSQVLDECIEIFADMGFKVAEGPDIESDDYNFTKLNIPAEHPARQEHDTFYLKTKPGSNAAPLVLRTHTSPVQIRTMLGQKPPIRIIAPGRVYRCDSDQTHTPMFHQIEGLVIDETTHMGHLKWVLEEMCKAFFEVDTVTMRFRASHFPFTEPSMEIDIDKGALGKPGEWLEIGGCGMVHPNVLRNCGLDPETYQGFAFGMGLDRMAMLKYGIPDLRPFFTGDLKWLRHYGFSILDQPTLGGGLSS